MSNLDVKHYLWVYKTRKQMQDAGITNPTDEIRVLTNTIVEKLALMPQDEKITLFENSMRDSKGNIIVTFPKNKIE